METVVNNPPPQRTEGGGIGLIIGALLVLAVVILLLIYGIPYMSSMFRSPSVSAPGHIDVNVHTPNAGRGK